MMAEAESVEAEKHNLTAGQIHQLMSVIAGMDVVKEAGSGASPPPTDEEIQQFLDYVGMGVVNNQRVEYEEEKLSAPEPPRRNKQACQYFWRRHYLSIIQEDEEEHNDATPGSSRTASRPGSTYENNISRLSRVMGALSPLAYQEENPDAFSKEVRSSWGSEISMESVTSVNSILSEEGSVTSQASFVSDENNKDKRERRAVCDLSSLLESVHPPSLPPSQTPDSMLSCESPSVRLSKAESEPEEPGPGPGILGAGKFKMGAKFKQSIQHIEDFKRKGKPGLSEIGGKVFLSDSDICDKDKDVIIGPTNLTSCDPPPPNNNHIDLTTPDRSQAEVTNVIINSPPPPPERQDDSDYDYLDGDPGDPEDLGPAGEDGQSLQVHPVCQAEEAERRAKVLGSLERPARRDLTISTLIAECEEYVKTDEFTKDLSDNLVHLFNQSKTCHHQKSNSTEVRPSPSSSESTRKPPKIPENMRTKLSIKPDKNEKNNTPKFPLNLRSSTYDNVAVEEGEDEGIENDYSDDSSGTPGPGLIHENSPAQTSEGYDSAQESGQIVKIC